MMTICPRRLWLLLPPPQGDDTWRADETCSYCGSVNPDVLMTHLEAGDVELTPTDKNYKVYVRALGGDLFCGNDLLGGNKFYFHHLTTQQRERFIELHNARKIKLGLPGHFYRLPFFMVQL